MAIQIPSTTTPKINGKHYSIDNRDVTSLLSMIIDVGVVIDGVGLCMCTIAVASFPGPTQLFVACSTEKRGEPGMFPHVSIT